MFGWTAAQVPLMLAIPILLVLSGFFSGSETALFGLTAPERMTLRRDRPAAAGLIDRLLAQPRMLLITVLMGNMIVNVLYFVIGSVLLVVADDASWWQRIVIAITTLLLIIIFGEVLPKLLANSGRTRIAPVIVRPLFALHGVIGPLRVGLDRLIISPLNRLTAPATAPPDLDDAELRAMLQAYGREGVIDEEEQRMLHDVLDMRRLKVRDVMTPRVRTVALEDDATRDDVIAAARGSRLTKIPVHAGDLDHVLGILNIKRFLLDPAVTSVTDERVMSEAHFVPDVATLDQLLEHFRRWHTQSAIVVDEYGGTEGIVSIEDVVEEIVGDIVFVDEHAPAPPQLVALGRWIVNGDMPVHEWAEAFDVTVDEQRASTLGGLIAAELGRVPAVNDTVAIGDLRLTVESVGQNRVTSVLVAMTGGKRSSPESDGKGEEST